MARWWRVSDGDVLNIRLDGVKTMKEEETVRSQPATSVRGGAGRRNAELQSAPEKAARSASGWEGE